MNKQELNKFEKLTSDSMIKSMYNSIKTGKITIDEFEQLIDIYIRNNRYKGIEYTGDCW